MMEITHEEMRSPDSLQRSFDLERCDSTTELTSDTINGRRRSRSSTIIGSILRLFRLKVVKYAVIFKCSTKNYQPVNEEEGSQRKKIVINPFLRPWSNIFKIFCQIAFVLDPLFFYIPAIDNTRKCLDSDENLKITLCVLRSVIDIVYTFHVVLHYRITARYGLSHLIVHTFPGLPLPQVVILIIAPRVGAASPVARKLLMIAVFSQYLSRLSKWGRFVAQRTTHSRMLPHLPGAIVRSTLIVCVLASHAVGAIWYILTVGQMDACWRISCLEHDCNSDALYCGVPRIKDYSFLNSSCPLLELNDIKQPTDFNFGIFLEALQSEVVVKEDFSRKLLYCFWWGWRNLCSLGQNLQTSKDIVENIFVFYISITGLSLFVILISRSLKSVMSTSKRKEEMRLRRLEMERWMSSQKLPADLRHRIRKHEQYKWQKTKGINEDALIEDLPKDLRMDIHHHTCKTLLDQVPLFAKMDDSLMDIVCDRLKRVLYTEDSYIHRKGDTIDEMLFLKSGELLSMTSNIGESTGFPINLGPGDICGEEIIAWALDPSSDNRLPISTKTIKVIDEVEAYALRANDLRFVASQFHVLNHEEVRHILRYYSEQWRTWAASCIQAAWFRYRRNKLDKSLREEEEWRRVALLQQSRGEGSSTSNLAAAIYESKFAVRVLRELRRKHPPQLHQKPHEPGFGAESSS